MNKSTLGIILTLLFVLLESTQFVYFGGLFQKMSSFQFGFLVFGITVLIFVGWTFLFNRNQFDSALAQPRQLLAVNIGAVVTFTAYLTSVQLLEPAIAYTISAGTMPVTAYVLHRLGIREGEAMRNRSEAIGNITIFISILFLAVVTVSGLTGFVRGDWLTGLTGVLLAVIDGVFFTLILVYSQRLSQSGVGPAAVLGMRLPLYVLVTGGIAYMETGQNYNLEASEVMTYVVIGFILTIPPLYLLQKAVSMISTLTLSALTALGPFVIFGLQIIEGRIAYKEATIIGLSIYFIGALLSAIGAVRGSAEAEKLKSTEDAKSLCK